MNSKERGRLELEGETVVGKSGNRHRTFSSKTFLQKFLIKLVS